MDDEIIEHLVLLNIREENESRSRVDQMVNELNALNSLDQPYLIYLTAGPIFRIRSHHVRVDDYDDDDDGVKLFSHIVHARFRSQSELDAYSAAVEQLVRPICNHVIKVVWTVEGVGGPLVPKPGSALRLTLCKLKQLGSGSAEESKEVIKLMKEGLRRMKEKWKSDSNNTLGFQQMSFGDNVNNKSGEEYWLGLGTLVVFPDLNELDASEEYEDEMRSLIHNHAIQSHLHSFIHLDYVLPRLPLTPHPPPIP